MLSQIGIHRFTDSRIERLLTKMCEHSKTLQLVFDGILHFSEAQLDSGSVQSIIEFADGISCSDIDAGHWLGRDHEPVNWGWRKTAEHPNGRVPAQELVGPSDNG